MRRALFRRELASKRGQTPVVLGTSSLERLPFATDGRERPSHVAGRVSSIVSDRTRLRVRLDRAVSEFSASIATCLRPRSMQIWGPRQKLMTQRQRVRPSRSISLDARPFHAAHQPRPQASNTGLIYEQRVTRLPAPFSSVKSRPSSIRRFRRKTEHAVSSRS